MARCLLIQGEKMNLMFKTFVSAFVVCAALGLSACGSSVKLDESVSVSDVKGTAVEAQPSVSTVQTATAAQSSSAQTPVTERAVTAVSVSPNNNDLAGPAGAAKVILFDYDSFAIKPEYQGAIDAHAKFLSANKSRKLNIEGHTDERGGREYNLALGQKRAEAVRRALALLGVAEAQVEAVSYGKEKPADAAASEVAYAKNRRAELAYR
jgi:peptidoglycan-associated lipoprotein